MSGIEVAGLVLGAVPILIEAIDSYKSGITKLKSGFRKRKVIEKLGRALRFQKSIVEAIVRNVLIQSGCDTAAGADDAHLRHLVQDKQAQEMVDDFLGSDNAQVFSDALVDCMADVSRVTVGLASLVPSLAPVKTNVDVQAVLQANAASGKGQVQLFARLSMVFKLENLEDQIEALDRSTNSLDKFTRNVTATHVPGENLPSRKATKLAKTLRIVRKHAINLHSALTQQWSTPCHQRHQLKVFLDDRINESKPKQSVSDNRVSCFQVVFVSGTTQPHDFWHETLFHIEPENHHKTSGRPPQVPVVRFSTTQQQSTNTRRDVRDICAAITDTTCAARYPVFHLDDASNIVVSLHAQAVATTPKFRHSTPLRKIFSEHSNHQPHVSRLPWKWRMVLAVKIASSFLQFIRTPWVQPSWSASNILIPHAAAPSNLDLSRPFLSADFSKNSSPAVNKQAQVREDLLDLGILLLEIWHESNLDDNFSQQLSTNNSSTMRHACALQWLDDLQNPLPDLYFRAASHCVSGLMTSDPRTSDWDNLDIWKSVCENIIDPLSKVAQI